MVLGDNGWWASIQWLGGYFKQYRDSAIIEAVCAAFGAHAAYTTAGRRYRLVREYVD
jgi:hypothetical protein